MFDRTNPIHDKLKQIVNNVVFGADMDPTKKKMVPNADEKHIKITNIPDSDPGAKNARRLLGSIIEILGAKGQYKLLPVKKQLAGDPKVEPYFTIDYSKVKDIKAFLW